MGVLVQSAVQVSADGTLDVDLRTVRVSGRVTLDGSPLPTAAYSRGALSLLGGDTSSGRLVDLDDATGGSYDVRLFRGSYRFLYNNLDFSCTGTPYPCQRGVSIRDAVSISADGTLDLDLPTIRLTGRVTLDGAAPPTASYSRGAITLLGAGYSTGELLDLDDSPDGTYDARIFPGRTNFSYVQSDARCDGSPYPCQTRVLRGCGGANP
jgi:hypothetical protein